MGRGASTATGAAGGAATGSAVGGPWGAAIGAGVGGLAGYLGGGDNEFSQPSFSDVDLQKDNPELYKQLMALKAQVEESERLYKQRRQGPTPGERMALEEGRAQSTAQLANRGLIGSSAGNQLMADTENRLQAALAERVFREQQELQDRAMRARAQYAQQYLGNQQAVLAPMQQAAQINFQDDVQEEQARNQFLSSLVNSGLQLYGAQKYGQKPPGTSGISYNAYAEPDFTMPELGSSYARNGYAYYGGE